MSIEITCAENKARSVLMNAGNVVVSVSGGADSDCMIDLLYRINAELSEKNVGCPFARDFERELEIIKNMSPNYI